MLLSAFIILSAGCSSQGKHSGAALYEVDQDYVDAVNRQARMGGMNKVDVYWVNPPVKRKVDNNNEEPSL